MPRAVRSSLRRALTITTITTMTSAVVVGLAGASVASPAGSASTARPAARVAASCGATRPGVLRCFAQRVVAPTKAPGTPHATPAGYGPSDLKSAYVIPAGGAGKTVAIVDAYDDPKAESDLATYRSTYGLPACTTANGCFKKVSQTGTTSYPPADAGWAEEISLDLDMASAVCPSCQILLVEATSPTTANLGTAVNYAAAHANAVSNSYGGSESSTDTSSGNAYYNHPGVAITASTGDDGYGVSFPASSPYVTAVGGTSLKRTSTGRGWAETVWSGTGGGCSRYQTKPTWQTDTGCSRRTDADVSAVADPNTGVAVYDSYGGDSGWEVFGGTSASSPIIAGMYALTSSTGSAQYSYQHPANFYDVTSGTNGSCGSSYLCTAKTNYDGPSGIGTPSGTAGLGTTVTLCSDINYGGRCGPANASNTDMRVTGNTVGNDALSSVLVPSGTSIALYSDINYGGRCQIFTGSASSLVGTTIGNDTVSSYKVSTSPIGC